MTEGKAEEPAAAAPLTSLEERIIQQVEVVPPFPFSRLKGGVELG